MGLAAPAQAVQQGQKPENPAGQAERSVYGQASSQEELAAYQAVQQQPDPREKVRLGEVFLLKYPASGLAGSVSRMLMFAYQQQNDAPKCIEYGERYLRMQPRDVEALSIMAFVYAESKQVERAAGYAETANRLLETFSPPLSLAPEQWKKAQSSFRAMNFSTLGYCGLQQAGLLKDKAAQQKALADSIDNFRKALALNPRDDYTYVRMGLAYALLDRADEAMSSYARAAVLGGPAESLSRSELERIYRATHENKLDGLDALLKRAAEELAKL